MSAPASSDGKNERRKSLGKYVKRMSSVFKRDKPAGESSSPSSTPAAPATTEQKKEEQPATKETTTAAPAPASPPTTTEPAPAAATTPATQVNHAAIKQERAIALFAKYGLTLEAHEWIAATSHPITVQRVERPIRMRMHRFCHHCGGAFGAEKVCPQCEHPRCKKCPRHSMWSSSAAKGKQHAAEEPKKKKRMFVMQTSKGEERIYQVPRQRIRRTCHKCQAHFLPATATTCDQCGHVRCTKCPRDPAKLSKWPNGYPGDAKADSDTEVEVEQQPVHVRRIWRKPRQKVRWECEECQSTFIDRVPNCPGCGHERCANCKRTPLKKDKKQPQFDPEIIRAVEEKLRAFAIDDSPASIPQPT